MSFLVDIILVAVILITVISGWKKGFIRTFMGLVSFAASIIVTWLLYNPVAKFIYDKILLGTVSDYIENVFETELGGSGASLERLFAELPDSFTNFLNRFSTTDNAAAFYSENTGATSSQLSRFMAEPIAETLSKVIAFIGLFIVIYIILKLLTKLLDNIVKLPLLNGVNKFLGLVLGAFLGLFIAWVLAIAFNALLPQLSSLFPKIFKPNTVDTTIIMRFFYNFNLFALLDMFKL
ncbi:MAG: CvpA family protein [Clostridia bacterium]|nr:CvpA family protein [Clostridia bacterium]